MKKAITNKYGKSVTVVERADWSIKFYDVETGRHYERKVWYPVSGSDIYVQHRGGFYNIMTEWNGHYEPQAISQYDVVSAEELESMAAEIIAHRAGKQYSSELTWEEKTRVYAYAVICNGADTEARMNDIVDGILQDSSKQPEPTTTEPETTATAEAEAAKEAAREAMEEAGEHERKAVEAAWSYDTETVAAHAQQAEEAAQRAEQAARNASYAADDAGTLEAHELADMAAEYAAYARRDADRATETAEANARELEERAEIIAAIEAEDLREYIQTEAERYQWSPEETRESIAFYLASCAAKAAARALLDAYAETIGETIERSDPEAVAAYRVAHDEMHNRSHHATTNDRKQVAYMVDVIARANTRLDLTKYESMTYLDMTA